MRNFTLTVLAGVIVIGALSGLTIASTEAAAQSRTLAVRSHATSVRNHVPRVRNQPFYRKASVGVVVDVPIVVSPQWYEPDPYYYVFGPYYYPPVLRVYEQPTVYMEQPAPPEQYWYYCEASKTYYPHVQTCATPWQRVIPYQ
jgi:hypothetical protein